MCADQGLASTYFWGISGAAWRTMDILGANLILARTMGHALGVDHPMIACGYRTVVDGWPMC